MHIDVKEKKSISPWPRRCYEDIDCYEYRVAMNTARFDSYLAEFLRFVRRHVGRLIQKSGRIRRSEDILTRIGRRKFAK